MVGYKVVAVEKGKRVSALCRNEQHGYILPYEVEYQERTRTIPKLGKLFAFLDQSIAEQWLRIDRRVGRDYTVNWSLTGFQDFEIWEAEVENPTPCETVAIYLNEIKAFWAGEDCNKQKAAMGAVNCDSITLTKCVGKYPNVPLDFNGEKDWDT